MPDKKFWQCDVTDREDNIWTGPVIYGSHQQAEFETMLTLQQDWGDSYMPDSFLEAFPDSEDDPEFPGDDAWDEAGYWDELDVNTFVLNVDPITALAKLGKIENHLTEDVIDAAMKGQVELYLMAGGVDA